MATTADNSQKSNELVKRVLVNRLLAEINEPRFPFQALKKLDSRLSYRKLNYWESCGLITARRDSDKKGWRKFSSVECTLLMIISDLKQHGLSLEALRNMVGYLTHGLISLEIMLVSSLRGGRYILVVDSDGKTTVAMNKEGISNAVRPTKSPGPQIVCHMYDYVEKVLRLSGTRVNFATNSELREFSCEVQELASLVHRGDFIRIKIKKTDGTVKSLWGRLWRANKASKDDILAALIAEDYTEVAVKLRTRRVIKFIYPKDRPKGGRPKTASGMHRR